MLCIPIRNFACSVAIRFNLHLVTRTANHAHDFGDQVPHEVHRPQRKLKARRGAKKAIVAIAHRILLGIYHVIKDGADFRDLGGDYLKLRNKSQTVSHLRKQALALGFDLVPQTV